MKHEGWELAAALDVEPSDDAVARLEDFERLLLRDAAPMGMIARSDLERVRERHLIDSLRGVPHLPDSGDVCDVGSGAGLPGVPLAICRPDLRFVLVEVRRNRAGFLRSVVEALGLPNVTVFGRRLETLRERFDLCTARAFARPARTWEVANHLLRPRGTVLYWAGASFDASTDLPPGVSSRLFASSALARSGPLVIMARQ